MADDLHALGLIAMPVLTGVVLYLRGQTDGWWKRLPIGLFLGLLVTLLAQLSYHCLCGSGNNPFRQGLIAGVCILYVYTFGRTLVIRTGITVLLIAAAFGLSYQFHVLALYDYRFTGDPTGLVLDGEYSSAYVGGPPHPHKFATSLWHTPISHLYLLHRADTIQYVER